MPNKRPKRWQLMPKWSRRKKKLKVTCLRKRKYRSKKLSLKMLLNKRNHLKTKAIKTPRLMLKRWLNKKLPKIRLMHQ